MSDEAPNLVWPQLLKLPSDSVPLVYLDQNHWIYLAQASTGHPNGTSFVAALQACRTAKSAGTAIFVLSAVHYMEMQKIKDPSQRRAIANVMEELTDFAAILDRVVVMELELDAMLDAFARAPTSLPQIPLVGRGVRHCFGRPSGVKIMGPTGDVTQEARMRIGPDVFDAFVTEAERLLSRSVLGGPKDEEVEELRARGWKPESSMEVAERRADQERKLTPMLDVSWRHGRLRDVISARELCTEFENILPRRLAQRHLVLADVISDEQSARSFVRAMPSTNVSIELRTAWHRNPSKPWTANDVYDIDALSLAVPYCDIVVTEKACHHVLSAAHLGEQMHTVLLRNLEDLPRSLQQCKPIRASQKNIG